MKEIIYTAIFIFLLVQAYALETQREEQSSDITLVDVSADGESCIFNIYGKTVVVDKHDTVTTDGITIYVQDVYPVNSKAQNTDRCKFMYSGMAETEDNINIMTIGEKVVHFLLGKRDEAEVQTAEQRIEKTAEIVPKEPPEETTVKVNGYDVTQNSETETTAVPEKPKTFFQKLKRFLFG